MLMWGSSPALSEQVAVALALLDGSRPPGPHGFPGGGAVRAFALGSSRRRRPPPFPQERRLSCPHFVPVPLGHRVSFFVPNASNRTGPRPARANSPAAPLKRRSWARMWMQDSTRTRSTRSTEITKHHQLDRRVYPLPHAKLSETSVFHISHVVGRVISQLSQGQQVPVVDHAPDECEIVAINDSEESESATMEAAVSGTSSAETPSVEPESSARSSNKKKGKKRPASVVLHDLLELHQKGEERAAKAASDSL
ncbi:hypothetical protein HPB50_008791 [Hyalomma asiaticum]|uniref:Uncharacterized protein n=1 Tax=Hyalomma asiaticum TaxID=266040 RepID=A0ACB7THB4_HYAAI|nr:hypothetical protein HPB50_008791 [Hyalomma asiaticum]